MLPFWPSERSNTVSLLAAVGVGGRGIPTGMGGGGAALRICFAGVLKSSWAEWYVSSVHVELFTLDADEVIRSEGTNVRPECVVRAARLACEAICSGESGKLARDSKPRGTGWNGSGLYAPMMDPPAERIADPGVEVSANVEALTDLSAIVEVEPFGALVTGPEAGW
jgi:hypothetical protein